MPRELFVDAVSRHARPRSLWTILGSLVTHLLILIALVVLPLTAAIDHPIIAREVIGFVPPTPPPPPPSLPPSRPRTVSPPVNPDAAPPSPGTSITPEKPVDPAADGLPIPGLPVAIGRAADGVFGAPVGTLTAPPPTSLKPVPVGGNVREPRRITYVPPVYPTIAQTAKVEGIVILEAIIDETGTVRDIRVLRSIPLLDRAAIDAVSRWRYLPTQLNGVAVPVIMTVSVSFTLR